MTESQAKVLDLDVLKMMYGDDSPDIVTLALTGYYTEARRYVSSLTDAADAADYTEVARLAHSLKSMSALVGAQRFSTLCAELEATAKQGNDAHTQVVLQQFTPCWQQLEQVVCSALGQQPDQSEHG